MPRLVLGTASFGAAYGVTKQWGVPPLKAIERILALAQKNNIELLDTAIAYGNCEEKLGKIGIKKFKIITKLPRVPKTEKNIEKWLLRQCQGSLKRLKIECLYGLLLHEPDQLLSAGIGEKISEGLQLLKNRGLVKKLGISIYCPSKLNRFRKTLPLDIIQAPANIFDQRFLHQEIIKFFQKNKIEFFCRSVFLQGLLLLPKASLPERFKKWNRLFSAYRDLLKQSRKSAVEACVSFVRAQHNIDGIVVGVNNRNQLCEILKAYNQTGNISAKKLSCSDIDLILPPRWKKSM